MTEYVVEKGLPTREERSDQILLKANFLYNTLLPSLVTNESARREHTLMVTLEADTDDELKSKL